MSCVWANFDLGLAGQEGFCIRTDSAKVGIKQVRSFWVSRVFIITSCWVPYPLTDKFVSVRTLSRRMLTLMLGCSLTLMLRRTGRVAVAAVAAVVGVAWLHLFLEGAGLICSF